MANVALVEKYPSGYRYESILPFDFDKYSIAEQKIEKILKKDITLDIDNVIENYEYIILVGKEPCKIVADIRSVTEYQGYLVKDKYIAMLNPLAVKMQPSLKHSYDTALNNIIKIVSGDRENVINDLDVKGIETEESASLYLENLYRLASNSNDFSLAMDTETSALYPRDGYVLGISLSYKEKSGVYIDSLALSEENIKLLQKIIDISTIVFHNAKFDMSMLEYHFGFVFTKWEDTMLIHYCLDENNGHGLKENCIKYTNLGDYSAPLEEYRKTYCSTHGILVGEFTYDLIPFNIMYPYAATDAMGTYELFTKFKPAIEKIPNVFSVYENILKPGTTFLKDVENNGIPVDAKFIEQAKDGIDLEIEPLLKQLYEFDEVHALEKSTGKLFNVNSPKQLQMLLFDIMGFPVTKRTGTGNPSADAEVLNSLAEEHKLPAIINEIKQLKSIKSKYLDKMLKSIDRDSRIRTNYNLHVTTSGRLSYSGKINAQQFPRKYKVVKKCVAAHENFKIVSQDLQTAEMYIVSVLSGDKNLQRIFINNEDYHGSMAVKKFDLPCSPNEVATLYPDIRQEAKTISFEILYKLNYREPALENFPTLKKWLQKQEKFIKANGYIYSIFGRKRRVEDVFSPNKQAAQHEVRSAINFLVQSVASDINLIAGIKMQKWIIDNHYSHVMRIFGLVHDSILAEVHEDYVNLYTKQLAHYTQADMGCSIPGRPIGLDLEIGNNYAFSKSE